MALTLVHGAFAPVLSDDGKEQVKGFSNEWVLAHANYFRDHGLKQRNRGTAHPRPVASAT